MPFGFDENHLSARLNFLETRAAAHLATERDFDLAATLLRDAACVALLKEDISKAKELLVSAGRLYLDLGVFSGSVLLLLAGEYDQVDSYVKRSKTHAEPIKDAENPVDPARFPNFRASSESPVQLISVLQSQSLSVVVGHEPFAWAFDEVSNLLDVHASAEVGATGLSVASYRRIAAMSIARPYGRSGREKEYEPEARFALESLITLAMTRRETLRMATADTHHWSLLLFPAAVVDLDAVVLAMIVISGNIGIDNIYRTVAAEELQALHVPFRIAERLMASYPPR